MKINKRERPILIAIAAVYILASVAFVWAFFHNAVPPLALGFVWMFAPVLVLIELQLKREYERQAGLKAKILKERGLDKVQRT